MGKRDIPQLDDVPSAGDAKVDEYVGRIRGGEKGVLDGLPDSFRMAIEGKLGKDNDLKSDKVAAVVIPPQYAGLPSEIVDMLWSETVFVDPEKTASEKERKRKAIEYLTNQEALASDNEEQERADGERITEIKESLATPTDNILEGEKKKDEFEEFKVKHGTTAGGEFTWNEYRNKIAKQMKESGTFEWGKERIYFDIAPEQFEQLRDLLIQIAGKEKIPVGFKYLDMEETKRTSPLSIDGKETWFVANFATREDAKKCYDALTQTTEYTTFQPGRSMDYKGIRLDQIAEYASGFREARGSLEQMMKAIPIAGGLYEYTTGEGRIIRLKAEDFANMKQQAEVLKRNIADAQMFWNK